MKLFRNFHERLLTADDSTSTISTVSVSEQDISEPAKASQVNSRLEDKSGQAQMDYLSAIFLDSHLPRLYKFESEDSGVELPSGANSPSTPTGSEQSFVAHSRESSCDSCNLNSNPSTLPDKLVTYAQSSVSKQAEDSVDNSLSTAVDTQDKVFMQSDELSSSAVREELHIGKDIDRDLYRASGISPEDVSGQLEENSIVTERTCLEDMRPGKQSSTGTCDDMTASDYEPEPVWSAISDSLDKYMDECCRLSEVRRTSSLNIHQSIHTYSTPYKRTMCSEYRLITSVNF